METLHNNKNFFYVGSYFPPGSNPSCPEEEFTSFSLSFEDYKRFVAVYGDVLIGSLWPLMKVQIVKNWTGKSIYWLFLPVNL